MSPDDPKSEPTAPLAQQGTTEIVPAQSAEPPADELKRIGDANLSTIQGVISSFRESHGKKLRAEIDKEMDKIKSVAEQNEKSTPEFIQAIDRLRNILHGYTESYYAATEVTRQSIVPMAAVKAEDGDLALVDGFVRRFCTPSVCIPSNIELFYFFGTILKELKDEKDNTQKIIELITAQADKEAIGLALIRDKETHLVQGDFGQTAWRHNPGHELAEAVFEMSGPNALQHVDKEQLVDALAQIRRLKSETQAKIEDELANRIVYFINTTEDPQTFSTSFKRWTDGDMDLEIRSSLSRESGGSMSEIPSPLEQHANKVLEKVKAVFPDVNVQYDKNRYKFGVFFRRN